MCKSVQWPSSIRLKPFKHGESLLEAKKQHSSWLCWCKSPLPWEQPLILGRAGPERDVRSPLLSASAYPGQAVPTVGQWSDTAGSTVTLWRAGHQHQSCQPQLQELSLALSKLRTTESKAQQSCTPAGFGFSLQFISQRCNRHQADSSTTQRASLATLQWPRAFLIGICPLFVFSDSPRGAYNDAHEDRWGFQSILSSAGTAVPFSWRNCALMPPAANKHCRKGLPWTHWARTLLLQRKKKFKNGLNGICKVRQKSVAFPAPFYI